MADMQTSMTDLPAMDPWMLDAFRIWFGNGEAHTTPHKQVAAQIVIPSTGKHPSPYMISYWANKYKWVDRRRQILNALAEEAKERLVKGSVDRMETLQQVVDLGIGDLVKAIREGSIKWTGSDIKRLIEAQLLLQGIPIESNTTNINIHVAQGVIQDAETTALATSLFERIGLGDSDASRTGEIRRPELAAGPTPDAAKPKGNRSRNR